MNARSGWIVVAAVCAMVAVSAWADEPAGTAAGGGQTAPAAAADNSTSPFAEAPKEPVKTRADHVAALDREQMRWYITCRDLAEGPLSSASMDEFRDGERRLLEITAPKALWPMGLALYTPNMRHRSAFLKAATQFARTSGPPTDKVALAYLSDMAVGDASGILRGQARAAILHPDTPKHADQLRYRAATYHRADVRERAAAMLADLKETAAVAELIEVLTTEEIRAKGAWVDTYNVILDIRATNAGVPTFRQVPVQAAASGMGIATGIIEVPTVRVSAINTSVIAPGGYRIEPDWEIATRRHAGVLAALKKLTGEDFGYDKAKWRQWLRSQRDTGGNSKDYDIQWDTPGGGDKKDDKDTRNDKDARR
ncbi:MAG: hypothetical protein GXY74_00780 [Phycisphaerae bacterium]|nr:hypothetical protein [Phycisphaerae bacterium]